MDNALLETGQLICDEVFLVADSQLLVDRRGNNYYKLALNYEGGRQIDGKVWGDNIGGRIETGQFIEVLARVDEYQGAMQLNIQRYRAISAEDVEVSDYVRCTDIDVDAAFEEMFNWERDELKNVHFKRLMREFYVSENFAEQFKISPAASRHHHNYRGGLVQHTFEMWNLLDRVCGLYAGRFDRELLLCGAALHDVGKIRAYQLSAGISKRTDLGELLDHIFIGASMVSNMWDQAVKPNVAPAESQKAGQYKALLLHIVLSHHGCREWGSPVLPRTPEAVLVHLCDQVSATLQSCFDGVDQTPDGQNWSDLLYIMNDPRKLYVPPKDEGP